MKITIKNRKQLIADFNEMNCTTFIHSRYIGVKVDGMSIVFRHCNGVGSARVFFDYNRNDGIFTRQEMFDGLEKHLEINR